MNVKSRRGDEAKFSKLGRAQVGSKLARLILLKCKYSWESFVSTSLSHKLEMNKRGETKIKRGFFSESKNDEMKGK